ncbi:MAG: hypothetical protein JXR58_03940 [Bacteroidales bacterium]|nr:hypothetical protein [Bacteroidales bacterium]
MPLDPMILNGTLDPFKNMLKDVESKNLTGADVDKMREVLARMEQIGAENDDMNIFLGTLTQENLFGLFSDHYGRALSSEAKEAYDSGEKSTDDASLLKQSIDALKNAIVVIKENYEKSIELAKNENAEEQMNAGLDYLERNTDKGKFGATGGMSVLRKESKKSFDKTMEDTPNAYDSSVETAILNDPTDIIKGIQDVIDLAEQPGMTLPRFLRLQMEKGLDKAMEGSVVERKGQEYTIEFTKAAPASPHHIEKEVRKLAKFDELTAKSKFGVPNSKELSYDYREIDREFDRPMAIWYDISSRWDDLLWDLSMWSLSYCSFAPFIKPWALAKDPVAATIKTQKTGPGIFKQKERLLEKYYGIKFHDIFKHETFEWSVKQDYCSYSQEFIEFLIETIYPECKPFNDLNSERIEKRASFYKRDRNSVDREGNPYGHYPALRLAEFYDKKFGEGRYLSRFGEIAKSESAAAPWNWNTFKFK